MSVAVPTAEMRAKLREWGPVIVLGLVPALPLLVSSGLVNTRAGGDSPFLLVRLDQLVANLQAGVFPVRWMPQAAYGLGYPFFNFYASLPIYLAAALKLAGVGYIWAIKLAQALGFVLAAVAIYGFSSELRMARSASVLAAVAYSCAPFHVVNVYVRGDSLSEFYAFVFFPLILWGLLRLQKENSIRNGAWVALSYAGLVLTHNISAVIFSPFVLLYALLLMAQHSTGMSHRQGLWSRASNLLALGTGLLLSAWFWLPALAEQGNVRLEDMTTGYLNYALHFRGLDLVQSSLAFDYTIAADRQPFGMGLIQTLLALAGLAAVVAWWIRRRRVELHSAFLVLLLATSTFMITPLSRPLWDHLPLLPLVQFPWRFLSLQALATSLLTACLVREGRRWDTLLAPLLGLTLVMSAVLKLQPEPLLIEEADITAERLMLYEYFTANVGTTIRTDYLPSQVDPRPYTSEVLLQGGGKVAPLTLDGQIALADLEAQGPTSERWAIDVISPECLLAFHTYYYPGWQARVDGQPAEIEALPGLGYIGLRLAQGRHEVRLSLGRTRVQRFAEILSAVTAILLLVALTRDLHPSPRTLAIAAASLGALALMTVAVRGLRAQPTIEQPLDLTMDFDRIPYLHHNPEGVRFGDAARLTHYELSSRAVQAGHSLIVHTYWGTVEAADLVTRLVLASPARHLLGVPLQITVDEQPLTNRHVRHVLQIPATTARGVYLLNLQLDSREGGISPVNARGETLGTTYLLPIRVYGETPASGAEPVVQWFGDRIALLDVQTCQQLADTLEVTLTWRVQASAPHNYKTALRLRDASGWEVARLDTQPGYGFHPTSMWRPEELVYDRYVLHLDDGTPPGTQYVLDATLYEAASLRPIGTIRSPDVGITQPTMRQDYPVLQAFGPAIALSEAHLLQTELEQGEKLGIALKWAAVSRVDRDYECEVVLIDAVGTAIHSQTMPPAGGYPSSLWPKDAIVASHFELRLAADIPVGQYNVAVKVREAATGEEAGTFTLPTAVRIIEAARSFSAPEMQQTVDADFGERIRLLGYDLQSSDAVLRLRLHWRALTAMDTDYKVFVHLFDPVTEIIMAQEDVLAGSDAYPTTRWVPDEVVSDTISLQLAGVPNGTYALAVGLYHEALRLSVAAPPGFTAPADRLLLNEAIQTP